MECSALDLSKYLGVATSTIDRWLRQGKLPANKVGIKYVFRTKDLEKWASKHNLTLNFSDKSVVEKEPIIPLSNAIQNGGIYFDISGNDINSVLKASIEKISDIPHDLKTDVFDRLLEREQALSTGIGNAIAIPHPREQLSYLPRPMVSVCFLSNPVDYKALDNQPVSILFFLFSQSLKIHLHLLSELSFCLRDSQFVSFLKSKPESEKLIKKIEIIQKANLI